jgi:hypothetical protein
VPLSQDPIRHVRQAASDKHADWSYERLAALRGGAVNVRDSGFLWIHERTHLDEIIERVDATVQLKRERDAYQASKKKRGA